MSKKNGSEGGRTQGNIFLRIVIVSFWTVAIFIAVFIVLFHVKAETFYFRYELGEEVSENLKDYISGLDWAVKLSSLDLSKVDESKAGVYEAVLVHGPFQQFSYKIEIQDTTAPEVKIVTKRVPIQRYVEYDFSTFITSYSDASNDVTFSFDKNKLQGIKVSDNKKKIEGTVCGEYTVKIIAGDPSGNETQVLVEVFVDDPPFLDGCEDYYVTLGSQCDFAENITAYDLVDGEIDIVDYDIKGDYTASTGEYEIEFHAVDSFGFEGSQKARLFVLQPLELQEKINSHEIDGNSDYVVGAINPYDMGVTSGRDISQAETLLAPTLVHIREDYPDGGYTHGSGYIINITDDSVIICTNCHVVDGYDSMDVYFFDGNKARGRVVSAIWVPDVAFMEVDRADLSESTIRGMKTIHLNTPYFNTLSDNPDLDVMIRANSKSGDVWKKGEGKILRKSGVLSQYYSGFDYPVTEVSLNLVGGMSGSPIVDETGSLICMAAFKWFNGYYYEYYGVKVTDIVAYFKEVFGKDADYYIAYQQ